MERLSANLVTMIKNRPTNTIVRDDGKLLKHSTKSDDDDTNNFESENIHYTTEYTPLTPPPDEFDGRQVWAGCLTPVKNQGSCGSCWAFASTSMLSDRFNIQSLGQLYLELSPAKLILCDWGGKEFDASFTYDDPLKDQSQVVMSNVMNYKVGACFGNSLYQAFRYLYVVGTCTEKCIPYDKNLGNVSSDILDYNEQTSLPLCTAVTGPLRDMCANYYFDQEAGVEGGDPQRYYRALHFSATPGTAIEGGSEDRIRRGIYTWGPVATGMKVYPDFYTFDPKTTIYEWNGEGPQVGGHAIEIVGWGIDKPTSKSYWIIKNSWGPEWGDEGYFRMVRGTNNCQIEANVISCTPDFFYPPGYRLAWATGLEVHKILEERQHVSDDVALADGIDPHTGYTRRVMAKMPWLKLSPPVPLKNLPDWSKFVAGRDSTVEKRTLISDMGKESNGKYKLIGIIFLVLLVIIIAVTILFKKYHKRRYSLRR